jgi:uncharacterized RDD family membrane protein YckC
MEHPDLEQQHLLNDFEDTYVRAQGGKRFANYIIDLVFFYILIVFISLLWAILSPGTLNTISENYVSPFIDRIIGIVLYILFMFAQETFLKGKSMGKFITGTCAVNIDGSTITAHKAMLRALSRAVPFCAFSALGSPCNPWQDKWTDTMVIDVKRSTNLNL